MPCHSPRSDMLVPVQVVPGVIVQLIIFDAAIGSHLIHAILSFTVTMVTTVCQSMEGGLWREDYGGRTIMAPEGGGL